MDPFEEGYEDYQEGAAVWENPYDDVTELGEARQWEAGWHSAAQDNSQFGVGG